jgi:hypothetical protein
MKRWLIRQGGTVAIWLGGVLTKLAAKEFGLAPIPAEEEGSYVEAAPEINPAVMLAAFQDPVDQSRLNACMETYRKCEQLKTASFRMLAGLTPLYGQEEAFVRMAANLIYHGMQLERRLSGTANVAGAAQELPTGGNA